MQTRAAVAMATRPNLEVARGSLPVLFRAEDGRKVLSHDASGGTHRVPQRPREQTSPCELKFLAFCRPEVCLKPDPEMLVLEYSRTTRC